MSWCATTRFAGPVAFCLTVAAIPFSAQATEGYFALGFGPVQRGTGGAGVAASTDAMGAALNPASVATLGREWDLGLELFAPDRGYKASGTAVVAPGDHRSGNPVFPVPNFAWNRPLANGNVLNIAAYGNGGLNTKYDAFPNTASFCDMATSGMGTGPFCGGEAGVDLSQLFIQTTYAGKSGTVSWGIAPTLAVQRFAAKGFGFFAAGGASADPSNFTDKGYSTSTGYGLRFGLQVEVTPAVSLGLSGQTKFSMTKFDEYAGFFEGQGSFDIPASVTAGVAVKASPAVTVMADYQRIYYSGVPAVSNPTGGKDSPYFGDSGGPGFGWDDVDVYKLGVAWAASDRTTLRAGYAHSSNPVGSNDVTLNLIAPGVVTSHYTVGASRKLSETTTLDFSAMYVPDTSVSGPEVVGPGATPGSSIKIDMHQLALSVGLRKAF